MVNAHFYPALEPYRTGTLPVDGPHVLYWEQCGHPEGQPLLFLHGGPGAGCTPIDRRFFDPAHFRVVLFDQRGCGRSRPVGALELNTIDHLVSDIEALRAHLGLERWHVFGGSWGSTLALHYAQQRPESCLSLTLRGICLLRDEELQWWLYGLRALQPELWRQFAEHLPADERQDLLAGYWKRLDGPDRSVALAAARQWSAYEGACCTLLPNPEFAAHFAEPEVAWAVARLEAHYFINGRFDPPDLLLRRVERVRQLPTCIVHGRYDLVCPVKNAVDLAAVWPEASLRIVPDAGHSSHEPGITRELVAATNRIRDHGSPALAPA